MKLLVIVVFILVVIVCGLTASCYHLVKAGKGMIEEIRMIWEKIDELRAAISERDE